MNSGRITYVITVHSKKLYEFLSNFKGKNDTWIVPFDDVYSNDFKYGFIGGLIDSDGTVTKYYIRIVNKNFKNLKQVKILMKNSFLKWQVSPSLKK